MESTIINKKNLIIAIIMLAAVLTRLVPHLPNFTPVTAIALFGGLYISNKILAYALPLIIMFISIFSRLFFHYIICLCWFYASNTYWYTKKKPNILTIFMGSLSFLLLQILAFGCWATQRLGLVL